MMKGILMTAIGDLIDLFDSAGFEHILSETEHNQDLDLIDFDSSLSNY